MVRVAQNVFWKRESSAKMHGTTLKDLYVCQRLIQLRKLRLMIQ